MNPGPSDEQVVELIRGNLARGVPTALVGFAIGASIQNAAVQEVRIESRGERDPQRGSVRVRAFVRMTYQIRGLIGPWVDRDESAVMEYLVAKDPADASRWTAQSTGR